MTLSPRHTPKEYFVAPVMWTLVGLLACGLAIGLDLVWLFWIGLAVAALAVGWLASQFVSPRREVAAKAVGVCAAAVLAAAGTWLVALPPHGEPGSSSRPGGALPSSPGEVVGTIDGGTVVIRGESLSLIDSAGRVRWTQPTPWHYK